MTDRITWEIALYQIYKLKTMCYHSQQSRVHYTEFESNQQNQLNKHDNKLHPALKTHLISFPLSMSLINQVLTVPSPLAVASNLPLWSRSMSCIVSECPRNMLM